MLIVRYIKIHKYEDVIITCNRYSKLYHFGRFCRSNPSNVQSISKINMVVKNEEITVPSESDVSSSDEYVYSNSEINDKSCANVSLKIEGQILNFQIDIGATFNILDEKDLPNTRKNIKVLKTDKKIFAYGSKLPLPSLGKFQTTVETTNKIELLTFYIPK